jgi:Spy/CpxP family protein refolding chaperone
VNESPKERHVTDINPNQNEPKANEAASVAASTPTPVKRGFAKPFIAGIAATLVTLGSLAGVAAFAKGPNGAGPLGGKMIERLLDRVEATDEQKSKINAIVERTRTEMEGMREERRNAMTELTEILKAPTIDRAALEAKRAERMSKMDQRSKTMTTAFADIAEVLSPEQRAEAVELIQKRMDKRGKGERGKGNRN